MNFHFIPSSLCAEMVDGNSMVLVYETKIHFKNKTINSLFFCKKQTKNRQNIIATAVHISTTWAFMCAVARYQEFKSSNQSFSVKSIHFLPGILLNSCNLATMRTHSLFIAEASTMLWKHWQTSKLEFSDLYVHLKWKCHSAGLCPIKWLCLLNKCT